MVNAQRTFSSVLTAFYAVEPAQNDGALDKIRTTDMNVLNVTPTCCRNLLLYPARTHINSC